MEHFKAVFVAGEAQVDIAFLTMCPSTRSATWKTYRFEPGLLMGSGHMSPIAFLCRASSPFVEILCRLIQRYIFVVAFKYFTLQ